MTDIETPVPSAPDFVKEGREIDVQLLRELALGRKRSSEIQLLLDGELERRAHKVAIVRNAQKLALLLADLSVTEAKAAATFQKLLAHRDRLSATLMRAVGVKTAAMDYLENVERALKIKDDDNSPSYLQLTQMAFTDQLTGLANYRAFSQRLRDEVRRCERYGQLLSLFMTDLDFFKQFNDRHGHPAGNKALQQVASVLFAEVRDTDLLARYGGEEFALLLPHTTKAEAAGLAERIRARVEKMRMQIDEQTSVGLTISLGVATFPRDARGEESLLNAADQALYQAKHSGRNRVCTYTPATVAHFRFEPNSHRPLRSVGLVGDFNDWKGDDDIMTPNESGAYELNIPLAPGRYHYKFVIDGKEYVSDTTCAIKESDGYGGINSVMTVE